MKQDRADSKAGEAHRTKQVKSAEVVTPFSIPARQGLIAVELDKGRKVSIPGFGTFMTRRRKAREGRNPATGRPSNRGQAYPVFKAGKTFKDRVGKK